MFSIKSVYITVPHESHNTILCVLTSMVHVEPYLVFPGEITFLNILSCQMESNKVEYFHPFYLTFI